MTTERQGKKEKQCKRTITTAGKPSASTERQF